MRIGFIGLGIMGSRMAANLIKKGFQVSVYNRTPEKMEPLVALGATACESVAQLAKKIDVLFTMVSTPEAVAELSEKLIPYLQKGVIWADCSTVGETVSQTIHEKCRKAGIKFIDAPVAGSLIPAENGQLVFLCGGDETAVANLSEPLAAMGRKTIYCGATGKGSAFKLVVNMIMGQAITAMSEGLRLSKAFGFDLDFALDNLLDLPVVAPIFKGKRDKYVNEDYSPEFPLQWMQKDMHLAAVEAFKLNLSLPQTNASKEIFMNAKSKGYGEEDIIAVIKD